MPNIPIDVTSARGWELLESELPEDLERLAREHKTLETQYGDAKLKSAGDLLRLIFLHAGADLALCSPQSPHHDYHRPDACSSTV